MTQYAKRTLPAGKIALLVAALIAALAIGYAAWRNRSPAPEIAAPGPANPGSPTIDTLEKKVAATPGDAAAWAALGFAYFSESRFDDAARAYDKAATLDSGRAVLWSALGEARVMASSKDPMPAAAAAAFEKAIALDPKDPRARYFLAVKRDLGGDHQGAIGDWLALLEDSPTDAPWRNDLVRTIDQVGKINKLDVAQRLAAAQAKSPVPPAMPAMPASAPMAARAIPGPNQSDLQNAASIPPSEQRQMAEGMVSRLETRLKSDPKNPDGWIMLIRSRMTLNQPDKAAAALQSALAANPERAAELRQQAGTLGVK